MIHCQEIKNYSFIIHIKSEIAIPNFQKQLNFWKKSTKVADVAELLVTIKILFVEWKVSSSSDIGPVHKAPPSVATQLVVPTDLSDGPVDLTCYICQHHQRTNTKSGPSFLAWALCCCMCVVGVWVSTKTGCPPKKLQRFNLNLIVFGDTLY